MIYSAIGESTSEIGQCIGCGFVVMVTCIPNSCPTSNTLYVLVCLLIKVPNEAEMIAEQLITNLC